MRPNPCRRSSLLEATSQLEKFSPAIFDTLLAEHFQNTTISISGRGLDCSVWIYFTKIPASPSSRPTKGEPLPKAFRGSPNSGSVLTMVRYPRALEPGAAKSRRVGSIRDPRPAESSSSNRTMQGVGVLEERHARWAIRLPINLISPPPCMSPQRRLVGSITHPF